MSNIKIEVEKSHHASNCFALKVKCADGTNLRDVLQALKDYKNQSNIQKAFDNDGVTLWLKTYTRYLPYGNITQTLFFNFLNAKP